ncbi:putative CDK4/6 [Westerdykella ornata]|uniref:non-specific serine/threonine protein kinase n=1 Tax=Westerdykella ornata TaxID=318751 RepID=A0A6A6JTD7_WESOR|nr:putative CDK4/6 [Westerdykella ornata]KAF2279504.1 putative CDK4/6 [Westerdykella ornata]
MASLLRWALRAGKQAPSPPHHFPRPGYRLPENAPPIEEEVFAHYSPSLFYPIRIGEVLNARYQVVGKLGYGSNSTVWLCRDLTAHSYVTVKVCNARSSENEIKAYTHLDSIKTNHAGRLLVRKLEDSFELNGTSGKFSCLVHKPLSVSLRHLRKKCLNERMPLPLLKATLVHILMALDFLHSEAHLIHTDLQEKNIILGLEDDSVLKAFENAERQDPSPYRSYGDRIIYRSRALEMPKKHGRPTITDFGEARFGQSEYDDDIQPFEYRAPEVIFAVPWSCKVDIWNVGVLTWDLFEGKNLFRTKGPDGEDSTPLHVAQMIALLGPPPTELLQRSPRISEFFDAEGKWKGLATIPQTSLEDLEENLHGEEKTRFLIFVRKMLQWNAEDRPSARELLEDPWFDKE